MFSLDIIEQFCPTNGYVCLIFNSLKLTFLNGPAEGEPSPSLSVSEASATSYKGDGDVPTTLFIAYLIPLAEGRLTK